MNSSLLIKYSLIFFLLFGITQTGFPQEINADVNIDYSQVNNTSLNNFHDLENKIQSYLNNYSWTNDSFLPYERIHATFQITLLSVSNNHTFKADLVVRSLRPIYHTNRRTTVFLYHDNDWTFHYTPNSDLIHDELRFNDITTLLDYYAFIILGYDYDTFSPLGGTPFFAKAQHLVSVAQFSSAAGWNIAGNSHRNRTQLVALLLNPNYQPLRRASYIYYRHGLDLFLRNPSKARQNILKALHLVQTAKRQTSNTLLFDIFFNTKADELASIFGSAPTNIRLKAYNLLSDLDPSHLSVYSVLQ